MKTSTHINQDEILKHTIEAYGQREKENITFHHLSRLEDLLSKVEDYAETELNESLNVNELKLALCAYFSVHWKRTIDYSDSAKSFLKSLFGESYVPEEVKHIANLALSIDELDIEKSNQEAILHDIYWSYLGEEKLAENLELLSIENYGDENQKIETLQSSFETISSMKFYTQWAIHKFSTTKSENIRELLRAIEKEEKKKKKKFRRSQKLGRGIETLYRSIYRNQVNLSAIADDKANIIIRVNTIILSIIITLGGTGYTFYESGFFKYSRFTVPIILLLLGSLGAVIFAVLSARPKIQRDDLTKVKIRANDSSVLFFGNFINLDKKDFVRELRLLRQDRKRVYDQMSVDIYYYGLVLDKKYRLVKISYNIFMAGLALSVLSFVAIFSITQFSL